MIFASCSTKKNTWRHRTFHSTTAYYNGYFNGREILKEAIVSLENSISEDYYRILPVYPMGKLENTKTIVPDADKAIAKASMVIKKHSIYIKGKEHNKFIDDAYLLLGQSYLYKRDYYTAVEMFNYVSKEFIKNSRRDVIAHQANAYLARAYAELGMFEDAQAALEVSLNDKTLKGRAKSIVYAALTDFYLKQNNYNKGLESILIAINETNEKAFKRRLIFIAGQLFQKTGQEIKASEQFKKVLKMTPPYEMAFYSRINQAKCYQAESGNSSEIRLLLKKMLKDQKNIDFADQIYYTLGEIEEKDKSTTLALLQYNKSVRASIANVSQKGLSYLAMANIYLNEKEYIKAAAYYDSSVSFLPQEHPDFKKVENKRNSLADLVKRYQSIALYDSLLKISSLTQEEIEKRIEAQILLDKKKAEKLLEEQKQRELIQNQQQTNGGNKNSGGIQMGEGQWYFYNPATKSFGFTEFRRIWGERPLEDNWRRSNKQTMGVAQNSTDVKKAENGSQDSASTNPVDSIALVKRKYREAIPTDEKMKSAYTDSITTAMYDLGIIYKDRLQDPNKSVEIFEDFLKRFPDHKFESTIYYQLYRIYLTLQNQSMAETYKKILLEKYPKSEYASIINDPDFFKNKQLSKEAFELFYSETFRLYKASQFSEALNRCREAELRYSGNILIPKFALLKAMCLGNLKEVDSYRKALEDVIKNHPGDQVKTKAKELLESLNKAQGIAVPDTNREVKPLYTYRGDTLHYFIVLFEDKTINLNDFKISLSDFNNQYFSTDTLKISSRMIGENYQMVQVQSFPNKIKAENYLKTADTDDALFLDQDMNIIDTFIISAQNFTVLSKEQKIKEYLDFFKKVYQ